ncbi:trimethylamine methyltransferase family protein [Kiloniella sp. b19]|uniref:trimethylamine methyltransferase family protein n=1 Tax=Kiloniella sp. GXU_MW_B19 TaxID=3141326 RepID=UPI0031D0BD31
MSEETTANPESEGRTSRSSGRGGRRGGRRGSASGAASSIPQLKWQDVRNPYQPFKVFRDEHIEAIHRTSMRVLSELGVKVMSETVMDIFEKAGAIVDRSTGFIRIDESLVEEALKTVPGQFTLTPRNPEKRIVMGGNHMTFGLVAGPPNVHDCINGRRSGNYTDYCNFIKLAHHFNAIHLIGNQVVAPIELPANTRHMDTYMANLRYSDIAFHCTAIGEGRVMDAINMLAITRGKKPEELKEEPGLITIISVNSPRLLDEAMSDGLIAMARNGQAVSVTPFTLMGAMTAVSLPAALAQQNAEALFGVVLTQLVNPGAPVMYGSFTSNVDMRSGAPAFGTPENAKANIAGGQLARRYGIPYRTSNANASNAVDLQAAYETGMSTWGAVLGGANIIYHSAGWLEGGLTASYEKLILDVEILQQMMAFMTPVDFAEDELGFDAIASVQPGGHFFGTDHTMARYQDAFYQPILSDWQNYENWEANGAKDALSRATEVWQQALNEYEEPELDPAVVEELEAYKAKRVEEIGLGEP